MRNVNESSIRRRGNPIRAALGIALLICSSCSSPAPPLWQAVSSTGGTIVLTPQAVLSLTAETSIEQLQGLPSQEQIELILPDENETSGIREVTALRLVHQVVGNNQFVWHGTLEGDTGSVVTFSVVNNTLVGDIHTSLGEMYRARFVTRHGKIVSGIIEKLNPAAFPREEQAAPVQPNPAPTPPEGLDLMAPTDGGSGYVVSKAEGKTLIDVMVLYTVAASDYAGSVDALTATINQAVFETNSAYQTSGVRQEIQLAPVQPIETAYEEQADIGADWHALKDGKGILATVSGLRRDNKADIVVLITGEAGPDDSCGVAPPMRSASKSFCSSAFAVVPANCAAGRYSFAHELGHLMGADHNDAAGTNGTPIPSRGYVHESPTNGWYTIMAYPTGTCASQNCPRILRWSNPAMSYPPSSGAVEGGTQAAPTGSAQANNAATLNSTAATVAAFDSGPTCN